LKKGQSTWGRSRSFGPRAHGSQDPGARERGVDFVIYPMMVWLFREALLSRHARWVEARRLDRFVRAVAIRGKRVFEVARAPER
jgi:hypothetical protein